MTKRVLDARDASPSKRLDCIALLVAIGLALAPVQAQDAWAQALPGNGNGVDASAVPAGAAAPAPAAIEPIPVDRIGVAAERVKRRAVEARDQIRDLQSTHDIATAIPIRRIEVEALLASSGALRAGTPNLAGVEQLQREWQGVDAALNAMQGSLGERAVALARMRGEIAGEQAVWEATQKVALANAEDPAVLAQIDATLADLAGARDAAAARLGEVAELQGRVAALSEATSSDLAKLEAIRRTLAGRVFDRDALPMWHAAFYLPLSRDEVVARLEEHRISETEALVRFVEQDGERLVFHGLATFLLIGFMLSARRRVRRIRVEHGDDDPTLEPMEAIFDRPVAVALVLSLSVGMWGYDRIPPLAAPIVGATALLPAILILRRIVPLQVFPVMNVLLGLYLVDRLDAAIAPLPSLPRLVFVAEMGTLFAFALWWRRPARLRDVPRAQLESTAFRWLGLGLRAALWLSLVAALADIAGFTALARIVGGTLLTAGYAAIVLYGASRALDGTVAYLLRVRPLRLSGMVKRHPLEVASYIQSVVHLGLGALFVWILLDRIDLVGPFWAAVVAFWTFPIPLIAVSVSVGSIIEFGIIVRLSLSLARFVEFSLDEEVYTRVRLAKGQPYAITTLSRYTVLFLGFLLALFALGIDLDRFTILAGAFGVGIGFGLQTIVNNFVSGIILLTEQPVQVGDTIELQGIFGEVQRIGIRSSTVRTWQGAEVIVPNAQLVAEQVTNWTLSDDRRRLEIPVGVAYGSDPKQVIALLEGATVSVAHVVDEPAPKALFMNFGDSALEFELRCWTDGTREYMVVRSAIVVEIEAALGQAGIRIPFPQRDLHVISLPDPDPDPEAG